MIFVSIIYVILYVSINSFYIKSYSFISFTVILFSVASKIKISESPAQPKAKFLRKSAFLATGNSSFKFNFNVTQETESDLSKDGNTEADTSDVDKKESMRNVNNDKINFSAPSSEFKFNFDVDNA